MTRQIPEGRESVGSALKRFLDEFPKSSLVFRVYFYWAVYMICCAYALKPAMDLLAFSPYKYLTFLGMGVVVWLIGFARGVLSRPTRYVPAYPPHGMIRHAFSESLVLAVIFGGIVRSYFASVPATAYLIPCLAAWFATWVVVIVLFKMYAPVTRWAFEQTRKPEVISADSYRAVWLFPVIACVAICLLQTAVPEYPRLTGDFLLAVMASAFTGLFTAGFGSGYIP